MVQFLDFHLEASTACQYDFLQIHDGPSSSSHSLGMHCSFWVSTGAQFLSHSLGMHCSLCSIWVSMGTQLLALTRYALFTLGILPLWVCIVHSAYPSALGVHCSLWVSSNCGYALYILGNYGYTAPRTQWVCTGILPLWVNICFCLDAFLPSPICTIHSGCSLVAYAGNPVVCSDHHWSLVNTVLYRHTARHAFDLVNPIWASSPSLRTSTLALGGQGEKSSGNSLVPMCITTDSVHSLGDSCSILL